MEQLKCNCIVYVVGRGWPRFIKWQFILWRVPTRPAFVSKKIFLSSPRSCQLLGVWISFSSNSPTTVVGPVLYLFNFPISYLFLSILLLFCFFFFSFHERKTELLPCTLFVPPSKNAIIQNFCSLFTLSMNFNEKSTPAIWAAQIRWLNLTPNKKKTWRRKTTQMILKT